MASKAKYIGYGTGVVLITALFAFLANSDDFKVEYDNETFCDEFCDISFNSTFNPINPLYTNFYLYNKEGFKLNFSQPIKNYAVCKADLRYKKERSETNLCGAGYREILISPYAPPSSYFYNWKKKIKNEWMVVVQKLNPEDTIKWSFELSKVSEDPVLYPLTSQACKNITKEETGYNYTYKTKSFQVYCDSKVEECTTDINDSVYRTEKVDVIDKTIPYKYKITICEPVGKVKLRDKIIGYDGYSCKVCGDDIVCNGCTGYSTCEWGCSCRDDGSEDCFKVNIDTGKLSVSGKANRLSLTDVEK